METGIKAAKVWRVVADIEYLDGALAGMVIPAGYCLTEATEKRAIKTACWLERVRQAGDFVRASVTGHRYQIVGGISRYTINAEAA